VNYIIFYITKFSKRLLTNNILLGKVRNMCLMWGNFKYFYGFIYIVTGEKTWADILA